jgi:transcriptional regulator with PAS, ATPase and Fis domain
MEAHHTALLVKSLIYVPLVLQNRPIGVLGVANRIKEVSFDSNDTRALSALASYATIAINNANIFRENQLERNTLSAVMDEMEEPLVVMDHHHRFLSLNAAARNVLDIQDEQVDGKPVTDFIENQDLLTFMLQKEEGEMKDFTEIAGQNGRSYQAHLKLISGGGRAIRLQPL